MRGGEVSRRTTLGEQHTHNSLRDTKSRRTSSSRPPHCLRTSCLAFLPECSLRSSLSPVRSRHRDTCRKSQSVSFLPPLRHMLFDAPWCMFRLSEENAGPLLPPLLPLLPLRPLPSLRRLRCLLSLERRRQRVLLRLRRQVGRVEARTSLSEQEGKSSRDRMAANALPLRLLSRRMCGSLEALHLSEMN
ncbi:hypothetical protein TGMAS_290682 [Toxoplasma gondii MAS]|uniref:Uncharacterized protein n=2 Tax=Toxoplasma gondii TaxID=5811 RepID=A0A086PXM1_TOXGO|nr:hypothetical protein TGMAS_290682 [Toxoplasma gondii MAS]PUA90274.1 hypothetical protein TGBR9_290682 [Toxoplasma gondii TgCATBr9]